MSRSDFIKSLHFRVILPIVIRIIILFFVAVFFLIHYFFTGSTAHATALKPAFLVTWKAVYEGDLIILALMLAHFLGITGSINYFAIYRPQYISEVISFYTKIT